LRYQRAAQAAADLRAVLKTLGAPDDSLSKPADANPASASPPRVLCIENRPKHQDVLRDYLSKRGYRVLLLSDVDRAVSRVDQQSPDGLILMGQSVDDGVVSAFERILNADRRGDMASLLVLSERQAAEASQAPHFDRRVSVLQQPVSLRTLRNKLEDLFADLGKPVPNSDAEGD